MMEDELMTHGCREDTFKVVTLVLAVMLVTVVAAGAYFHKKEVAKLSRSQANAWKVKYSDLQLGTKLGEGAFAVVYKAKWHGKDVAVKVFNEDQSKGVNVTSFIMEVAILNELRHPNIVLFMGACFEAPKMAIITELLKCSLFDLIEQIYKNKSDQSVNPYSTRALQVPWVDRVQILIDAAQGMSYLHEIGMLHHDLKSPNLLLGTYHNCKVSDFGMISVKPGARRSNMLRKSNEFLEDATTPKGRGVTVRGFNLKGKSGIRRAGSAAADLTGDKEEANAAPRKLFGFGGTSGSAAGSSGGSSGPDSRPSSLVGGFGIPGSPSILGRLMTQKNMDPNGLEKALASTGGAGTPQWTPPEVIEGGEYTEKADVFSFGIIMAEVCNLEEPYPGLSAFEVTIKVVENNLRPTLHVETPQGISKLAMACMSSDPNERPSFSRAAADLQEILAKWNEASPPDSMHSRFKSDTKSRTHRGSISLNILGPKEPQDPFREEYGQKSWWCDKEKVTASGKVLLDDGTIKEEEGTYDPSGGKSKTKRRLSLGLPTAALGGGPSSPFTSAKLASNPGSYKVEKPKVAGSVIFGALRAGGAAMGIGGGASGGGAAGGALVHPVDVSPKEIVLRTVKYGLRTDLVKSFAKDAEKAAALKHKNVMVFVGGWIDSTALMLVTERASHGTLRDRLDAEKGGESSALKLPVRDLQDVIEGLRYLHSREVPVIHKDVRAATVLCCEAPPTAFSSTSGESSRHVMKLSGFLFEAVRKAFSKEEQKIGIPAYSPPEVIMGEQYSKEGDIYSFGILMWEAFTGQVPFQGMNWQELGTSVCMQQQRPTFPEYSPSMNCDPENYDKFRTLCAQCWHGDPAKRLNVEKVKILLGQVRVHRH